MSDRKIIMIFKTSAFVCVLAIMLLVLFKSNNNMASNIVQGESYNDIQLGDVKCDNWHTTFLYKQFADGCTSTACKDNDTSCTKRVTCTVKTGSSCDAAKKSSPCFLEKTETRTCKDESTTSTTQSQSEVNNIPNCEKYQYQSANKIKCTKCKLNYYVNSNGTCSSVSSPCCINNVTEKNLNTCQQVAYQTPSSFAAGACASTTPKCSVDNCSTCESGSTTRCSKCNSNYYVNSNGTCSYVSAPCCINNVTENSLSTCQQVASYTPSSFVAGACAKCSVDNCTTCESGSTTRCSKCKNNYSLNKNTGKCYYSGGGGGYSYEPPVDIPPVAISACYKNSSTNQYEFGTFEGVAEYSNVGVGEEKCNKVVIQLVDENGKDLQGATITVTSNNDSKASYSIGTKTLELLDPGTYTIKETVAPTNFQADSTDITIIVNSNGNINVTGSTDIDLKNSNNTRNVTIIWKNTSQSSDTEEKCYYKYEGDGNNEYCFGTPTSCNTFSEFLSGRDQKSCKEDIACYKTSDGKLLLGKYANREGYEFYSSSCPKCYKQSNGRLVWGSFENVENYTPLPNVDEANCVSTSNENTSSNSKVIYIFLIVLIVLAIIFVLLKKSPDSKSGKKDKHNDENDDKEDYDYNYHI